MPGLDTAIIAGIPAIYKFFESRKQSREAKKLLKTPRPVREIAGGVVDNLALAKNRYAQDMPGSGQLKNDIYGSSANAANMAIQSGQSPSSIMSTISSVNANQLDKFGELNRYNAEYRDRGLQTLMGANSALANEQNQAWDWNKKQKYLSDMLAASALQNASKRNVFSAINDVANIGVGLLGNAKSTGIAGTMPMAPASSAPATIPYQLPEMNLATKSNEVEMLDIPPEKRPLYDKFLKAGIPMSDIKKLLTQ